MLIDLQYARHGLSRRRFFLEIYGLLQNCSARTHALRHARARARARFRGVFTSVRRARQIRKRIFNISNCFVGPSLIPFFMAFERERDGRVTNSLAPKNRINKSTRCFASPDRRPAPKKKSFRPRRYNARALGRDTAERQCEIRLFISRCCA